MEIIKDLLTLTSLNSMENFTDGCRRDKDGYWITGRVDDVIIVSGHNLGTEIESAFVAHLKLLKQQL